MEAPEGEDLEAAASAEAALEVDLAVAASAAVDSTEALAVRAFTAVLAHAITVTVMAAVAWAAFWAL